MTTPEPNRPPPGAGSIQSAPADHPTLRLATPAADAVGGGADAVIHDWLAKLELVLPPNQRTAAREELGDHLRCRVNDLLLTGQSEAHAAATACEEMGDPAQLAHRFRSALSAPRRRFMMNLSIFGLSGAAIVAGMVALNPAREPVPVSVFQTRESAVAPEGYLRATVTTPKDATFQQLLTAVGAPSKLAVDPAWSAFEEVGLAADQNLGLEYGGMSVEAVLADINDHLEPQQRFEWRVAGPRLVFAPRTHFDRRERVLATYDIAGIARAREAAAGEDGSTGQAAQEVCGLITELVEADHWRDNGGDLASITRFGDKLFITAPPRMHEQVRWVLSELPAAPQREALKDGELRLIVEGPGPRAALPPAKRPEAEPGARVRVLNLQRAASGDVAKALSGVLTGANLNGVSMAGVRVEAMPQTNSLLIVAEGKQLEAVMEIVSQLEESATHAAQRRDEEKEMLRRRADHERAELQRLAREADTAANQAPK